MIVDEAHSSQTGQSAMKLKMALANTDDALQEYAELEGKAEDVIYAIRQSSAGRKDMSETDWKQLYQAVDQLYPTFHGRVSAELGREMTEQKMKVCYLMRIGLSKPQIQGMTNLSRVTVWRWVKKFDWVMTNDDEHGSPHHNDNSKK